MEKWEKYMETGRSVPRNRRLDCAGRQGRTGTMAISELSVNNRPSSQQRESGEWFDKYSRLVSTSSRKQNIYKNVVSNTKSETRVDVVSLVT